MTDLNPSAYSTFNESETRYNLIDPSIKKAGWNLSDRTQIWFEVPVQGYDASPASGITDYCLYRTNGEVLAVIEAKKTKRDARVGKEQVFQYVTEIEKKQTFRPFAFMANGDDIWFWDSDTYPERHYFKILKKRKISESQNRKECSDGKHQRD